MPMGILFGLLTALTWGGSDFLARFATRQIGTLRTMFYMQATGLVLLSLCLPALGGWGHLHDGSGWQPWAWGVLAGCINAFSTLTLYRSFEVGKLAVVAPLSATYPALTVTLSWLSGEHLTAQRLAGIVFMMFGAVLVARVEQAPEQDDIAVRARGGKGVGWALCSSIGFGVLFWLLGNWIVPRVGAPQTVWMIRLTSVVITAFILLLAKQSLALPKGKVRWTVWSMGLLDTSAFVVSNRGMQLEQVAVVSVLGSLYGAVTAGLAAAVLKERVQKWQWVGIVTIFAGILLIGL
jgi:drug/metabolite transporter (DMT)-like permease